MHDLTQMLVALPLLTLIGAVFGRMAAAARKAGRPVNVWNWGL